MRFTIKAKLALSFTLILVLSAIGMLFELSSMTDINGRMERVIKSSAAKAFVLQETRNDLVILISQVRSIMISNDLAQKADFLKTYQERQEALEGRLNKLESLLVTDEGRRMMADIRKNVPPLLEINKEIIRFAMDDSMLAGRTMLDTMEEKFLPEMRTALQNATESIQKEGSPDAVLAIMTVNNLFNQQATINRRIILAMSREEMDDLETQAKALDRQVTDVLAGMPWQRIGNGVAIRGTLERYFADYAIRMEAMRVRVLANTTDQADKLLSGKGLAASRQVTDTMDQMVKFNLKLMDDDANAAVNAYEEARTLTIGLLVGILLVSSAIALFIALSISRGLAKASSLANAVAEGDLNQTITVSSRDEIADLVTAMTIMTANLKDVAGKATEISNGNLTIDVQRVSDRDELGIALEMMIERLRTVVSEALSAAQQVSAGSQQLSATAEQMAQGSTEQAAAAEEASSSMEEMVSTIRQSADNASETERIAGKSAKDAEQSGQ
ncbi:MCP four helix bundle domain-containing protein, partial [Insolitispirillum peregrinum]|uniref:MCP four helix bundle domain-containing protein n=1 Tax=Insolitispirillum peregrinum TaxID=80876 RepID=UPI00361B96FA